jgi:hypothetical protein
MNRRQFLLASSAALLAADARDEWSGVERVVVIGDVHGDHDAMMAAFRMGGIVDGQGGWIGGKAHAVQIGDVPARGSQTRKAMDALRRLEQEAEAAGGKLHALIGNHDAMPMYGQRAGTQEGEYAEFRTPESERLLQDLYDRDLVELKKAGRAPKGPAEIKAYREHWDREHPLGSIEHALAFRPEAEYGKWVRGHNAVIKINDVLFAHAGVSPKYLGTSIRQFNETIRSELAKPESLPPGMTTDLAGPLWYRGMGEGEPGLDTHVEAVLAAYGVRRVVIGHSVTRSAILPRFGGRVVNVDLGLSRVYNRPPACLVLEASAEYVLHKGARIPLPGTKREDGLEYLAQAAKADGEGGPVWKLYERERTENRGRPSVQ